MFLVLRPKVDFSKLFLIAIYLFVAILTYICFKRGKYVCTIIYIYIIIYRLYLQMKNQN